jgi:peptide chain release factor 2
MPHGGLAVLYGQRNPQRPLQHSVVTSSVTASPANTAAAIPLDLTDFKRDLSELTDRLGQAQDCL